MGINMHGGSKTANRHRREMGRIRAVGRSPIAVCESEEDNYEWVVYEKSDGRFYGVYKRQMNAIRKAEKILIAKGYRRSSPYINYEWVMEAQ